MTREELGQRISQERQRANLTQDYLAAAIGLERSAISRIEQGKQGIDSLQLARIADVFGRPVGVFFQPVKDDSLATLFSGPGVVDVEARQHIDWAQEFVRDFAFLRRLAKGGVL